MYVHSAQPYAFTMVDDAFFLALQDLFSDDEFYSDDQRRCRRGSGSTLHMVPRMWNVVERTTAIAGS